MWRGFFSIKGGLIKFAIPNLNSILYIKIFEAFEFVYGWGEITKAILLNVDIKAF